MGSDQVGGERGSGMDGTISAIAAFASAFTYQEIPASVDKNATRLVVDSLACGIGGRHCEAAGMGRRLAPMDPNIQDTGLILTSGERTTADIASFINVAMIRYLDYNDTFPTGHPSDCLGALLAIGGARNVPGRDFLAAMVVTYEVYNRLTESARMRYRGWDQGAAVAVALSAGLGNLFGMTSDEIGNAIALSAVSCVPLRATRAGHLSLWKGAATAQAAREAVFLTNLAKLGMTGPPDAFEGRHGHWDLITGPFQLRPFPPAGGEFLTEQVRLKYWPVEYNTQIAVWAALDLRARMDPQEVESIDIGTYWSAWHETGSEPEKWEPETRETADHSLPYVFARALLDRGIDINAFEPAAYTDPAVRTLMKSISVAEDAEVEAKYPETVAIKVCATSKTGDRVEFELENPRGHECNPMTTDEVSDKFMRLSAGHLAAAESEKALQFWWALADQEGLQEGLDLLTARPVLA